MPDAAVVIVGGGAAGLSSGAALGRRGIAAVVFERDAQVGGSWARRYDRLRLHTIRRFSGLAHLPIPDRYPTYLSRDDVVGYLREYAQHFDLRIVSATTVLRIRPQGTRGWVVDTLGPTGPASWTARAVVIATGQYRDPVRPPWPGRDSFRGRIVHSADYVNAAPFAGQRVLVVGAGNSGAEIATDLADHGAAFVAISVRTPPPIVPRDPFGWPVQRTSLALSLLPAAIANRLGWLTARLVLGDLTRYGLPAGPFAPYTTCRVPVIDVGFVDALKRGRVRVRPALERVDPTGVAYVGGVREAFDTIIAATGFSTGLASVLDVPGVLNENGEPRGASGEPTASPGLYFVGFTHSLRGHLFEINRASRRLAQNVAQYLRGVRP